MPPADLETTNCDVAHTDGDEDYISFVQIIIRTECDLKGCYRGTITGHLGSTHPGEEDYISFVQIIIRTECDLKGCYRTLGLDSSEVS